MILYGLALVPLAKFLRTQSPTVCQPWYADDAAMSGKVMGIAETMRLLLLHGPSRGYFPEPSKSIIVCRPEDRPSAEHVLREFNFKFADGTRYIGSFIDTDDSMQAWLAPKIDDWVHGVKIFSKVAKRFPQTAYAGLSKSLQSEWTYLQRVVPDIAEAFAPIEDAIATEFLPALFGNANGVPERKLLALPVRFAGLGVPNPVSSATSHFNLSVEMTEAVTSSLKLGTDLDAASYGRDSSRIHAQDRKDREASLAAKLASTLESAPAADQRRLKRSKATGAWLTATPSADYGTALSSTEFRDSLRIRYGLNPLGLASHCDACPNT